MWGSTASLIFVKSPVRLLGGAFRGLLGGSWVLRSRVIRALNEVMTIVTPPA